MEKLKLSRTNIRKQMEVKPYRATCGEFKGPTYLEQYSIDRPRYACVPPGFRWAEGMIVIRAWGRSMEPRIRNGSWALFHLHCFDDNPEGKIVLVAEQKPEGDRYSVKKFHRRDDGAVELLSFNPSHPPIELKVGGEHQIRGWYVGSVPTIQRIKQPRYQRVSVTD